MGAQTPFEDLESLITVLVKYLETHMGAAAGSEHGLLWCVGGSLKATLDGASAPPPHFAA